MTGKSVRYWRKLKEQLSVCNTRKSSFRGRLELEDKVAAFAPKHHAMFLRMDGRRQPQDLLATCRPARAMARTWVSRAWRLLPDDMWPYSQMPLRILFQQNFRFNSGFNDSPSAVHKIECVDIPTTTSTFPNAGPVQRNLTTHPRLKIFICHTRNTGSIILVHFHT